MLISCKRLDNGEYRNCWISTEWIVQIVEERIKILQGQDSVGQSAYDEGDPCFRIIVKDSKREFFIIGEDAIESFRQWIEDNLEV